VELADRGTIKVQHSGDVAAIWASASEAGVRIRSMVPARNTLEQVFIEAVSGDSHAHS